MVADDDPAHADASPPAADGPPVDGRTARAVATRERVLEAAQEQFLESHYEDVTLDAIADQAGVTRQTVHNAFGSKGDLLAEAARSLLVPRHRLAGPAHRPALVTTLVEEYEQVGDTLVRLLAVEDRVPAVAALLVDARAEHHEFLASILADVLPPPGPDRTRFLGAVHAALDVQVWKLLRRDLGFSVGDTEAVLGRFLSAALDAAHTDG